MTTPAPYQPRRSGSTMAVTSLVLGIVGLVCCLGFLPGLAAVVTGMLARRDISESGGTQPGIGMANAGLALGLVSIVVGAMLWILYAAGVARVRLEY